MKLVRSTRGGRDYVSAFGERQRGTGPVADLIAQRFRAARQRLGLGSERRPLRTDLFVRPALPGGQLSLL
jgi:hypothetical protein